MKTNSFLTNRRSSRDIWSRGMASCCAQRNNNILFRQVSEWDRWKNTKREWESPEIAAKHNSLVAQTVELALHCWARDAAVCVETYCALDTIIPTCFSHMFRSTHGVVSDFGHHRLPRVILNAICNLIVVMISCANDVFDFTQFAFALGLSLAHCVWSFLLSSGCTIPSHIVDCVSEITNLIEWHCWWRSFGTQRSSVVCVCEWDKFVRKTGKRTNELVVYIYMSTIYLY